MVVEARERSGALITADFALEEGREVFAVPGEISSALSAGTNALLRLGATPLLSPDDLFASYGLERARPRHPDVDDSMAAVLAALADAPAGADELGRRSRLGPGELSAALSQLELAGLVLSDAGVYRASLN